MVTKGLDWTPAPWAKTVGSSHAGLDQTVLNRYLIKFLFLLPFLNSFRTVAGCQCGFPHSWSLKFEEEFCRNVLCPVPTKWPSTLLFWRNECGKRTFRSIFCKEPHIIVTIAACQVFASPYIYIQNVLYIRVWSNTRLFCEGNNKYMMG